MSKNNFLWLRRLHGKLHTKYLPELSCIQTKIKKETKAQEDYPVDFVVLWVDGSDEKWLAENKKYRIGQTVDSISNCEARYRDWDLFQYWFRSVEKYAPWVRYVYLVTWGHLPEWLNLEHPKLRIVNHEDFIPKEYLPTFSTSAIITNVWRIEELSEHFVCFNDDMYLTSDVSKEDFFCNGLPKLCSIAYPLRSHSHMTTWEHGLFNMLGQINSEYNVSLQIELHPEKWFSHLYGPDRKYNEYVYKYGFFPGIYIGHLAIVLRKSSMEKACKKFEEAFIKTWTNKFRSYTNVVVELFNMYEMLEGSFEPVEAGYFGFATNINYNTLEKLKIEILNENNKIVCANDFEGITNSDFLTLKSEMQIIMKKKFPNKSSFER